MANFETRLSGEFDLLLRAIEDGILGGSATASLEASSDTSLGGVRCAVRVFERYSALGGNRLSLSVTLLGRDGENWLCAAAAGGSQAMFLKLNTFGENAFLEKLSEIIDRFRA